MEHTNLTAAEETLWEVHNDLMLLAQSETDLSVRHMLIMVAEKSLRPFVGVRNNYPHSTDKLHEFTADVQSGKVNKSLVTG